MLLHGLPPHPTRESASRRAGEMRSWATIVMFKLVGGWIRATPERTYSGIAAISLEVAVILTRSGIQRGVQADPTWVRIHFGIFTSVLLLFVLIIGFGLLALQRYLEILERTRDWGILRVLGASNLFFCRLLLCETAVIAIPGTLVGIALTYVARIVIALGFPDFLRLEIAYIWWGIACGIAAAGSMLGGIIGARNALRDGVVQALSYEK